MQKKSGYGRVRVDGDILDLNEAMRLNLDKKKKHTIDVVVDRITISEEDRGRLADSLETALELGDEVAIALNFDTKKEILLSQKFACPDGHMSMPELAPRNFSFNSPHGACPECTGLGTKLEVIPELVIPNPKLTLAEGAIRPWSKTTSRMSWYNRMLQAVASEYGFSLNTPVKDLPKKYLDIVLYGSGEDKIHMEGNHAEYGFNASFEGVVPNLERKYKESDSDYMRQDIENYMRISMCPVCHGKRLKPEFLSVTVTDLSIADVTCKTIEDADSYFSGMSKKTFS